MTSTSSTTSSLEEDDATQMLIFADPISQIRFSPTTTACGPGNALVITGTDLEAPVAVILPTGVRVEDFEFFDGPLQDTIVVEVPSPIPSSKGRLQVELGTNILTSRQILRITGPGCI